jgi:outer membrane protein TolC
VAINTYAHDLAREDSSTQAVTDAAQALRDSERLQVGGRATTLAVVDAQRAYATAKQTLAQLETSISEDQISTFLALGGGWDPAPGATPMATDYPKPPNEGMGNRDLAFRMP